MTFEPEVRRAIDCAVKACSCGRVDFCAYKPRVVRVYLIAPAPVLLYRLGYNKKGGKLKLTVV